MLYDGDGAPEAHKLEKLKMRSSAFGSRRSLHATESRCTLLRALQRRYVDARDCASLRS